MSIPNVNKSFLITGSLLSRVGLVVALGGGALLITSFLPHSLLGGVGSNLYNLYTGPGLILVGIAIEGVSGALVLTGLLRKGKKEDTIEVDSDIGEPAEEKAQEDEPTKENAVLSFDAGVVEEQGVKVVGDMVIIELPPVKASLLEGTAQVEEPVEEANESSEAGSEEETNEGSAASSVANRAEMNDDLDGEIGGWISDDEDSSQRVTVRFTDQEEYKQKKELI